MMDGDRKEQRDSFLNRWSRLKTEARDTSPPPAATPMSTKSGSESHFQPATRKCDSDPDFHTQDAAPELPPLDKLTLESDFRGFFHPKVNEDLRRAALRKLFAEPHFNVMDGLDVYIDDYSKTEPIPAAMLAGMKQAQRILDWAKGKEDEPAPNDEAQEAVRGDEAQAALPDDEAQQQAVPDDPTATERSLIAVMPPPDGERLPEINPQRDAIATPTPALRQHDEL